MIKMSRIVALFVCLLCSYNLHAEELDDLYQIEIIFFAQTDSKRFSAEEWPKFVGNLDTKNVTDVSASAIEPSKMLLNEEEKIIKRSKNHKFIQHLSWTQTLLAGVKSSPMYLQAGEQNEQIQAVLDFKPVRNMYNISVDIIFKSGDKEYRFTRDVKTKKNEMYYIDHPMFGAMLMITPLKLEKS